MIQLHVTKNQQLSQQLENLGSQLEVMDRASLEKVFAEGSYTGPQQMSMVWFRMLELTQDTELYFEVLKGWLLDQIESRRLYLSHPAGYSSIQEAVQVENRISPTQFSNITGLYKIVFPYVERQLQMTAQSLWSTTGKSNLYAILPHLKQAITGIPSLSNRVHAVVERIYEEVDALEPNLDPEERK